ncbi:MAG TPA: hypothetical protein VGD98_15170 [Ktedonobacteraceae bacterium]
MQTEMRHFSQATGTRCRGDLRLLEQVPAEAGVQILLAIKEGLTNVARHAHARGLDWSAQEWHKPCRGDLR